MYTLEESMIAYSLADFNTLTHSEHSKLIIDIISKIEYCSWEAFWKTKLTQDLSQQVVGDNEMIEILDTVYRCDYLPTHIYDWWAHDDNIWWREIAGANTGTPQSILAKLAFDSSVVVRVSVARNSKLSEEIFNSMLESNNLSVKYAIAGNFKTPKYILKKLARNSNPYVKKTAKDTLAKK